MNKDEVISIYSMEELIPIVGRLTKQFTSHESSSVMYERARQFMEAVIYCIAHWDYETEKCLIISEPSAEVAYRIGYEAVINKVKRTQEKYNQLLTFFDDYGNRNYRDTVEKAILGLGVNIIVNAESCRINGVEVKFSSKLLVKDGNRILVDLASIIRLMGGGIELIRNTGTINVCVCNKRIILKGALKHFHDGFFDQIVLNHIWKNECINDSELRIAI